VAVVELEPMEDEGAGYLFDLSDGHVLFLKGQGYEPTEDDDLRGRTRTSRSSARRSTTRSSACTAMATPSPRSA
jgi:hypothetical protein